LTIGAAGQPPASQPQSRPATTAASQPQSGPKIVKPFEGVTVMIDESNPVRSRVEISGMSCLDAGWLEQVACGPATREHESLVVIKPKPSQIHAALLMAGFEPGKPGKWIYENDKFSVVEPTGAKLAIAVRYTNKEGKEVEHDIADWIREPGGPDKEPKAFPHLPFIFGGSIIAKNTPDMGPGEHYVADMTGSIIGLVTFGDEMIGFSKVRSDQDAVQEPIWEVNSEKVPEMETRVTVIISKWKD